MKRMDLPFLCVMILPMEEEFFFCLNEETWLLCLQTLFVPLLPEDFCSINLIKGAYDHPIFEESANPQETALFHSG